MPRQRPAKPLILFALLLILFLFPLFLSSYWLHVFITIFIWIMIAEGMRLLYTTGQLTLGQAAPWGIGAYACSLFVINIGKASPGAAGMWFWPGLLVGAVAAGIFAVLIGIPTLRVRGVYFVIVTFAVAEFFRYLYVQIKGITGGVTGVVGIPPPAIHIGGLSYDFGVSKLPYYYLILIVMLISMAIMYRVDRSRIGSVFRAIHQQDSLAEHVGINIMGYKLLAFTIACFFAGLAGGLFAHYTTYISPDNFTVLESLYAQMYALIGGLGASAGSLVGPTVLIGLSEVFRSYLGFPKETLPILIGVSVLVIVMFLPRGLISLPQILGRRMGQGRGAQ